MAYNLFKTTVAAVFGVGLTALSAQIGFPDRLNSATQYETAAASAYGTDRLILAAYLKPETNFVIPRGTDRI